MIWLLVLSETSVNLQVEGVEVVAKFGSAALVGEGVVSLEDEVLAEVVVGRKSPVGLQAVPGFRIAIAVPAAVELEVLEEPSTTCIRRARSICLRI